MDTPDKKNRGCLICALFFGLMVTASLAVMVIWDMDVEEVFFEERINQEKEIGSNPMVELFNTPPDFAHYTRDQKSFEEYLWNSSSYGGSIIDPINLTDRSIPNNLDADL